MMPFCSSSGRSQERFQLDDALAVLLAFNCDTNMPSTASTSTGAPGAQSDSDSDFENLPPFATGRTGH